MIRRFVAICILTAAAAFTAAAAERATFVLTSGQRVSGELTYKGGTVYTLDGKDYPSDDVAVIEFSGGEPPVSELQQLPATVTQEHERDMFVMRDGSIVKGKLYHIANDGTSVSFDPLGGSSAADRRTVPSNQIARIYINAPKARQVYASKLNKETPSGQTSVATSGTAGAVTVQANQAWTDTGITVRRGEWVSFTPSGQIEVIQGGGANVGPEGNSSAGGDRGKFPFPAAPVGALLGKVGNGAPFPIGSNTSPIQMTANGRLYLGINDDNFPDNNGSFSVVVHRNARAR